jgi:spermidine synthase
MDFGLLSPITGLESIHTDALAFLGETPKTYDAILLNLPEPSTFQVNRFYTLEAFRLMAAHLTPEGVLAFSVGGFDGYLSRENKEIVSCLYRTASRVFGHILMIPGQDTYLICANRPLDADIPALLNRNAIPTRYIADYYSGDVSRERRDSLLSMIRPDGAINTDARPVLMTLTITQWFARHQARPIFFIGGLLLAAGLYLPRLTREEYLLFTTGFTTMGLDILVLFSVQIVFGYLYVQMGILITAFLAGLLPGAFLGDRMRLDHHRTRWLARADLALAVLALLFVLGSLAPGVRSHMAFYLLTGFAVSLTCGFQFPLVLASDNSNALAGRAFSADLTGAAFGVLLTSVILVPIAGLPGAAVILCLLKLSSLLLNFSDL